MDRPDVHLTLKMPQGASLNVDDFSSEVTVEGLRAGVTLETFSSTMNLRDVEGPLDLETFSGKIEGEGLRGSVQLETFSGDVELTLPADAGFELVGEDDAFGNLNSDFALRTEDGRRISSGGGPRVKVETFSGALRLRKQ